jgi:hypothetical protein
MRNLRDMQALRKPGTFVIKAACLLALIAAIVWNVRFGIADLLARRNQPDNTRVAMQIMSANAAYPAQLADEIYATDPASALSLLQRSVKLNPNSAQAWIQLGLLHEEKNDLQQAQSALLRAANVDATFLPSWSLANFYFRQGNVSDFWSWAQKAAEMDPDNATPLFRLAWYTSPNAGEIEERLKIQKPLIEIQLVNFLMSQGNPGAVSETGAHLLAMAKGDYVETVLSACEWLIENKRADLALPLWDGLAERGKIAYSVVTEDSPDTVTNGDFNQSPISRGFDWHMLSPKGVSPFLNSDPNALGFEFSGDEPESFVVMFQTAPVRPLSQYTLEVDYSTSGLLSGSGIEWLIADAQSESALAETGSLSAEKDGKAYACFTAPVGAKFVNLKLQYQRRPGTVLVEGRIAIRKIALTKGTAEECKNGPSFASGAIRHSEGGD